MDSEPNQRRAEDWLDFAGHAFPVEGLGPGRRVALWVRGCSLACPGCMTPELWQSGPRAAFREVSEVARDLLPLLEQADGLTISGGEPMEQPAALAQLVKQLRAAYPDLEVLVYSGYSLEELLRQSPDTRDFLGEIDMLIDRRFVDHAPNTLRWRGSDNQRVHLLSEQSKRWEAERNAPMPARRPLAIQPVEANRFRLVGIPGRGDFDRYRTAMRARGIWVEPEATPTPDA